MSKEEARKIRDEEIERRKYLKELINKRNLDKKDEILARVPLMTQDDIEAFIVLYEMTDEEIEDMRRRCEEPAIEQTEEE